MLIQVFQVDEAKDGYRDIIYLPYNPLKPANPDMYKLVYEGYVDAKSIETVYAIFNSDDRPNPMTARSMSVSDIVRIVENPGGAELPGLYYCNVIGFKKIPDIIWNQTYPVPNKNELKWKNGRK